MKISNRIKIISKKIPPYKRIADIGCDHGYLIIESILNHNVEYAIGIDNKIGPINSARLNIDKYGVNQKVRLIQSYGIDEIENIDVIILAGMGSDNIIEIVSKSIDKLNDVKRIIIDSHKDIPKIRKFFYDIGFIIIDEEIIYDMNKYYEIITFEKKGVNEVTYSNDELIFGPMLLKERSEVFVNKYKEQIINLDKQYLINKNNKILIKINKLKEIIE